MSDNNGSPESLHNVGQGTNKMMNTPKFVSPGTPSAPLVTQKDLANPVMSEKGTNDLRANLIKGN